MISLISQEAPMGDLLIRNIPEALKRDIAERADRNGTSLSDEAKGLLSKALAPAATEDAERRSAWDVLRPILCDDTDEFSETMDEIEAGRKKDFIRSFEDLN
jgi:plasmid stability protein